MREAGVALLTEAAVVAEGGFVAANAAAPAMAVSLQTTDIFHAAAADPVIFTPVQAFLRINLVGAAAEC